MMAVIELRSAFQRYMEEHGLVISELPLDDGQIHRVHVDGDKHGTRNGWYVLYTDGFPAGAFGSWRVGSTGTWSARAPETMTATERVEYSDRLRRMRQQREAEVERRQQQTAIAAKKLWNKSTNANPLHPYLIRKKIRPHHLRQVGDTLLVPLIDADGEIWNLQRIFPDGTKRFLAHGRVKGCFALFGPLDGDSVYVCEGMATGATVHQHSGLPTVCAMNAGNLLAVCTALTDQVGKITICADNDRQTGGNPGITKGREAAAAVGASLTWPESCGNGCRCSDFNDIAQCERAQEVAA
ncbi:toprim domain-containing protein [Marinobacterium aestuariivivens]|uniref:Toprim domain-containing protein n=1 Tax=Marinobacterium aestuariivivens TaxID=1698799 RepID=A0ABW1ZZ47_9GAMM